MLPLINAARSHMMGMVLPTSDSYRFESRQAGRQLRISRNNGKIGSAALARSLGELLLTGHSLAEWFDEGAERAAPHSEAAGWSCPPSPTVA